MTVNNYIIVACSSRGTVSTTNGHKAITIFMYIMLALALFFTAMILLIITGVMHTELQSDWEKIGLIAFVTVLLYGVLAVFAYLHRKHNVLLQYIEQCMIDAVECHVYINEMGMGNLGQTNTPRYCVSVQYQGDIVKVLTCVDIHQCPDVSYFARYSDRDIMALYSPQYNEVLLLQQDDNAEIL